MSSTKFPKCCSKHSVLQIVLPHCYWDPIQQLRSIYMKDIRCGPHFNLAAPFVDPAYFDKAAEVLIPALSSLSKISFTLEKFSYVVHPTSVTLYIEPTFENEDTLKPVIDVVKTLFPQCHDLYEASENGDLRPHFTIGKFHTEQQAQKVFKEIQETWKPIKIEIHEIYMNWRSGSDPYEIKKIIPIGSSNQQPYFGPNSLLASPQSRYSKSLFLSGFPPKTKPKELLKLFSKNHPIELEIVKNFDGTPRPIAVIELSSAQDVRDILAYNYFPKFPKLKMIRLYQMTYPSILGESSWVSVIDFKKTSAIKMKEMQVTFHTPETKFDLLSQDKKPTDTRVNETIIHLNSPEIWAITEHNLNSEPQSEPMIENWADCINSNEFSKNWAQEVEKEEMEKRKKPQIENEVMISVNEFDKGQVFQCLSKRKSLLTNIELNNLIGLQSIDGFWIPSALESYFHISSSRFEKLLTDCGARSFGVSKFQDVLNYISSIIVLSYLKYHFEVEQFSFLAISQHLPHQFQNHQVRLQKAQAYLKKADTELPFLCDRLGLGMNWNSITTNLWNLERKKIVQL